MSHHIGDLENLETLTSFEEGIEHFKRLFYIEPKAVAYDLHRIISPPVCPFIPDIPRIGVHLPISSVLWPEWNGRGYNQVALDGTVLDWMKPSGRKFIKAI
jgi:hydrogenase maturation protein HypF